MRPCAASGEDRQKRTSTTEKIDKEYEAARALGLRSETRPPVTPPSTLTSLVHCSRDCGLCRDSPLTVTRGSAQRTRDRARAGRGRQLSGSAGRVSAAARTLTQHARDANGMQIVLVLRSNARARHQLDAAYRRKLFGLSDVIFTHSRDPILTFFASITHTSLFPLSQKVVAVLSVPASALHVHRLCTGQFA